MTTASKITLARVALIPMYMVFMYLSDMGNNALWKWLSLGIFIFASLTDYVDGYIARKYNQVSDFGKFLDPLADKLLTIEFAVTGLRLVAVGKGTVIAAGKSGKFKTASSMVGLCVLMAFPQIQIIQWIVAGVIVLTTVYSGIEYFVQNWNCLWDK